MFSMDSDHEENSLYCFLVARGVDVQPLKEQKVSKYAHQLSFLSWPLIKDIMCHKNWLSFTHKCNTRLHVCTPCTDGLYNS